MCSPIGSIIAGILMQNDVKELSLKMTVWNRYVDDQCWSRC